MNLITVDKNSPGEKTEIQSRGVSSLILMGGCFWGLERSLSSIGGMVTQVGYAGSESTIKPTYYNLDISNYAEACWIQWPTKTIMLQTILQKFSTYSSGDPSPANYSRYRRAILCPDKTSFQEVEKVARLQCMIFNICNDTRFIAAESYHQGYYARTLG